jgi:hypothetical protein
MPCQFSIRVRVKPNSNLDSALLVQVVIMCGRYVHQRQRNEGNRDDLNIQEPTIQAGGSHGSDESQGSPL